MWSILNGTIVNVFTVLIGGTAGLTLGKRLPERYQRIILDVLGLVTVVLGVDAGVNGFNAAVRQYRPIGEAGAAFGPRLAMVMVGSLVLGAIIGTALRLHERIEALGAALHRRLPGRRAAREIDTLANRTEASAVDPDALSPGARFAQGFLASSVLFCIGPLTLLGCLNNGARGDPGLLYVKACLDAFSSMAPAASLGSGVLGSILTIVVIQGGLSLAAAKLGDALGGLSLDMMNVVGGVVLLATALLLLEIRKIPVANLVPAIFLPPALIALARAVFPAVFATP